MYKSSWPDGALFKPDMFTASSSVSCNLQAYVFKCEVTRTKKYILYISHQLKVKKKQRFVFNIPGWCKPPLCRCTTLQTSSYRLWRSLWSPQRSSEHRREGKDTISKAATKRHDEQRPERWGWRGLVNMWVRAREEICWFSFASFNQHRLQYMINSSVSAEHKAGVTEFLRVDLFGQEAEEPCSVLINDSSGLADDLAVNLWRLTALRIIHHACRMWPGEFIVLLEGFLVWFALIKLVSGSGGRQRWSQNKLPTTVKRLKQQADEVVTKTGESLGFSSWGDRYCLYAWSRCSVECQVIWSRLINSDEENKTETGAQVCLTNRGDVNSFLCSSVHVYVWFSSV